MGRKTVGGTVAFPKATVTAHSPTNSPTISPAFITEGGITETDYDSWQVLPSSAARNAGKKATLLQQREAICDGGGMRVNADPWRRRSGGDCGGTWGPRGGTGSGNKFPPPPPPPAPFKCLIYTRPGNELSVTTPKRWKYVGTPKRCEDKIEPDQRAYTRAQISITDQTRTQAHLDGVKKADKIKPDDRVYTRAQMININYRASFGLRRVPAVALVAGGVRVVEGVPAGERPPQTPHLPALRPRQEAQQEP